MGDYLKIQNGITTDKLAKASSAGAGDAGSLVKLNDAGKIDVTMLPAGVAPEQRTIVASEALSAGDLVNIWNDGGTPKVRKADATTAGKEAHGFVLGAVSSGASATVWPEEAVLSGLSGLTPGARYFLSTTAGQATNVAPSAAGNVAQVIGYALSATEIQFRPESAITLA
jgi:hypothetical protein